MNRTDAEVEAKVKELKGWDASASAASRAEYVERENERIRQQRESNMQATRQDIYGGDRA